MGEAMVQSAVNSTHCANSFFPWLHNGCYCPYGTYRKYAYIEVDEDCSVRGTDVWHSFELIYIVAVVAIFAVVFLCGSFRIVQISRNKFLRSVQSLVYTTSTLAAGLRLVVAYFEVFMMENAVPEYKNPTVQEQLVDGLSLLYLILFVCACCCQVSLAEQSRQSYSFRLSSPLFTFTSHAGLCLSVAIVSQSDVLHLV